MNHEGVKKIIPATTEEQIRSTDAYRAGDPTSFSELSPTHLYPTEEYTAAYNRPIKTDGESRFVPLTKMAPRQQIVARILKGISNVADVVQGPDGQFHSKILPHDRIEQEGSGDEAQANAELVYLTFGDFDHRYYPGRDMDDAEHNNLRVEHGRVSMYDFAEAEFRQPAQALRANDHSEESLALLDSKLSLLEQQVSGPEGLKFLTAIVESAGVPLQQIFPYADGNENAVAFQEVLLRRIAHARFLTRQKQSELRSEAA